MEQAQQRRRFPLLERLVEVVEPEDLDKGPSEY